MHTKLNIYFFLLSDCSVIMKSVKKCDFQKYLFIDYFNDNLKVLMSKIIQYLLSGLERYEYFINSYVKRCLLTQCLYMVTPIGFHGFHVTKKGAFLVENVGLQYRKPEPRT